MSKQVNKNVRNFRHVLSIGLAAATLTVVLTYVLGTPALLQTSQAEQGHNQFMSLIPGITGGQSSMAQMNGGSAPEEESTMQGMKGGIEHLSNNVLGSPAGNAAAGFALAVLMAVIPLAGAAFGISWNQRSFVVAGLLTASGIILMVLPLANMNFVIPGPILGVVVGLAILGLGVAKGVRMARAMTATLR
jgi:hypothetical protein